MQDKSYYRLDFWAGRALCVGKWCKEPLEYIYKNTDQQQQMDLSRWQNSEALLRSTSNDDLQTVWN